MNRTNGGFLKAYLTESYFKPGKYTLFSF
ncbi:MAG: hypothetical protein ACI8RP_001514, partial [Urechidicola sp.]